MAFGERDPSAAKLALFTSFLDRGARWGFGAWLLAKTVLWEGDDPR
jgi:hypothetical protein